MAKNPYTLRNLVSREDIKSLIYVCYLVGIILTGIGAELRENSPNYDQWINTIDCGNIDLCGVVLVIAFSSLIEVPVAFIIVSFISTIFFIYERLYKRASKKIPQLCIVIKCVFLLFLLYLIFGSLDIIWTDFKWGFYVLSLANLFIVAGIMITFYLGLTLKKAPSLDLSDTFWA